MLVSRDSVLWWYGLAAAVVTAIAMQIDKFTWFSDEARQWISLAAVVVAAISGTLKTSPLPSGQAVEVGTAKAKVVEAKRQLEKVQDAKEPKVRIRKPKAASATDS